MASHIGDQDRKDHRERSEFGKHFCRERLNSTLTTAEEDVDIAENRQSGAKEHTGMNGVPEDNADCVSVGGSLIGELEEGAAQAPHSVSFIDDQPELHVDGEAELVVDARRSCFDTVGKTPVIKDSAQRLKVSATFSFGEADSISVVTVGGQYRKPATQDWHWLPVRQ